MKIKSRNESTNPIYVLPWDNKKLLSEYLPLILVCG